MQLSVTAGGSDIGVLFQDPHIGNGFLYEIMQCISNYRVKIG